MPPEKPSDRRQWPRVEALLKVEYLDPAGVLSDYLGNLGRGGMFVHTKLAFEAGQELSFSLSLPGLLEPLALRGVVRWRRAPEQVQPESPAGIGVEFILSSDEEAQLGAILAALSGGTSPQVQPFRVLIVEDNEFANELFEFAVRRYLTNKVPEGAIEITRATDAGQALASLEQGPVELAIVDHFLPAMSGCELVRAIRGRPETRDTRVLVVSVGGEEVREEAYRSGADLFLDKPVVHRELPVTLGKLFQRAPGDG